MNRALLRVAIAVVLGAGLLGVVWAGEGVFPGLHGGAGTPIESMNLNGTKTNVDFRYHGPRARHLEARVVAEDAKAIKVGVSLWKQDVAFSHYDAKRNTLEVYTTPAHLMDPNEVRIGVLTMTEFEAPAGLKTVRVVYLP